MSFKKWVLIIIGIILILIIAVIFLKEYDTNQANHGKEEVVKEDFYSDLNYEEYKGLEICTEGDYSTGSQSKPLVLNGYAIVISLKNKEETNEGYNDIEPKALIKLTDLTSKTVYEYNCPKPTIKIDNVTFKSVETPIGVISFKGTFVDRDDKRWSNWRAEDYKTILKGILVIIKAGTEVFNKEVRLEYVEYSH